MSSDPMPPDLSRFKNVLLVSSGKGGVGKTTIAVSLALNLKKRGYRVGFLDTDIYGPNALCMLGVDPKHMQQPTSAGEADDILIPPLLDEMPVMSMSFFLAEDQPVLWRGPMLNSVVQQFLFQTQWGELDYLIIDTPPGTGDVQLSLGHMLPINGAIIVTTAQSAALTDTRRSIAQFEKLRVPVLGIVENMSSFVPEDAPEKSYDLFGSRNGETVRDAFSYPLIGRIPFEMALQNSTTQIKTSELSSVFYTPLLEALSENILNELQKPKKTTS